MRLVLLVLLDILPLNATAAHLASIKVGFIAFLVQMSTFNVPHAPITCLAQPATSAMSQAPIAILAL